MVSGEEYEVIVMTSMETRISGYIIVIHGKVEALVMARYAERQ